MLLKQHVNGPWCAIAPVDVRSVGGRSAAEGVECFLRQPEFMGGLPRRLRPATAVSCLALFSGYLTLRPSHGHPAGSGQGSPRC
jgi:hypothetical protein